MKKYNYFVLILAMFFLCSCEGTSAVNDNDYSENFQHYDLSDKGIFSYIQSENNQSYKYAIADISKDELNFVHGFFYQRGANNYILLDTIDATSHEIGPNNYYFYANLLYVNACNRTCHYVYTLNHEITTKKELKLDTSKIEPNLQIGDILKVDANNIYFSAKTSNNENINIKCDLTTNQCVKE